MNRLVVGSLQAEGSVQLVDKRRHSLAGTHDQPRTSFCAAGLGHPSHRQGCLGLAVLAEKRGVTDDAVHRAFQGGCQGAELV